MRIPGSPLNLPPHLRDRLQQAIQTILPTGLQVPGLATLGQATPGQATPGAVTLPQPLKAGDILDHRYKVLQQLGQGGFGRTYIVEDSRRHQERCVLKEFAPQLQDPAALRKAKELFLREAKVLHGLKHPQIPEFREVFELTIQDQPRWFLVQEWIEGPTYLSLLKQQPLPEAAVLKLFKDLLPVLDYLLNQRPPVFHRDISPDNIICSTRTSLPVLIDFGTVKQAFSSIGHNPKATIIIKKGYSPEEQRLGHVYPSSDLYALGVTAIALLTGQADPAYLYNPHTNTWNWRSHSSNVSPGFTAILDRLLQDQPEQRYPSAIAVLQELATLSLTPASPVSRAQPLPQSPSKNQPELQPGGGSRFPNANPAEGQCQLYPTTIPPTPAWQPAIALDGFASSQPAAPQPAAPQPAAPQPAKSAVPPPPTTIEVRPQPVPVKMSPPVQPTATAQPQAKSPQHPLSMLHTWVVAQRSPQSRLHPEPIAPHVLDRFDAWLQPLLTGPKLQQMGWWALKGGGAIVALILVLNLGHSLLQAHARRNLDQARNPDITARGNDCQAKVIERFKHTGETSWEPVDEQFWAKFPEMRNQPIESSNPTHQRYIKDWCQIANDWLDTVP